MKRESPSSKLRSLARYVARSSHRSRAEAVRAVESGAVTVNGRRVTNPGHWIRDGVDEIVVDGEPLVTQPTSPLYLFNKPRGVLVTDSDPEGRPTYREQLGAGLVDAGVRAVGRLDRASAGLLLLTSDSDLAHRVLDPASRLGKTYEVKLRPAPGDTDLDRWRAGLDIGDRERTKAAEVITEHRNPRSAVVSVTLHEGRNRQIRRMAEAIGCAVERLIRTRIGPLELGTLEPGSYRVATDAERSALDRALDERARR